MVDIVPTIGRIVLYKMSDTDAQKVNKRRADAHSHMREHIERSNGVMVHVGNEVHEGDVFPAVVVKTWGTTPTSPVNLKVEMDGSDTYWATSRMVGEHPGSYHWMEYQKGQAAKYEALEAEKAKVV